jgi:6-phosphogluconolactonase
MLVSLTRLLLCGMVLAAMLAALPVSADPMVENCWVFIGTYTGKMSKGIYRCQLDPSTGKLSEPELAAETPNPTFLAIHPSRKYLYAVNEIGNFMGKKSGAISAFELDARTGKLTFLNQVPSVGDGPCHLVVDAAGKHVLAANYGGGSVCVLPIQADGRLSESVSSFVQHVGGSNAVKGRQEAPHAHSINLDAANRFAFVADLGLDKVLIYRFDPAKGTLKMNDPASVILPPGSGPRHYAFHPDGKHAYAINELASTITVLDYNADKGALEPVQTISTLPMETKGNSTAEVVVHPSGKFVYGSNRGHDSIAIFTVDPKTGKLEAAGHARHEFKTPRNFAIDPTGTYLLVGGQGNGKVVVFKIDQAKGSLTPVGEPTAIPAPVCMRFVPIAK